jgi:hypothetical protein
LNTFKPFRIALALVVLLAALGGAASARPAVAQSASLPGVLVYVYAAHTDSPIPYVPPPAEYVLVKDGVRAESANITVNYIGIWDPQAVTAFEQAVSIWETLLTSPVEIRVNATWENLGPGVLGGAGPANFRRNFANAPVLDTWYPRATADKLAGTDLDPGTQDINAQFNSAFSDWYFGTDGQPPFDKYDFVSVVLHELGHGLGFTGSMRVGGGCGTGLGCWGSGTIFPFIYDRFAVNGSAQSLIDTNLFGNPSPELAAQLTSNNVFFNGPSAVKINGGNVKLYAPNPFASGSSYSHLDEIFNGTPNALMTFSASNGEAIHSPGNVTLCMFKDMGWTVTLGSAAVGSQSPAWEVAPLALGDVTIMVTSTVYLPLVAKDFGGC